VSHGTSVVVGTTKEGEVFISRILPGVGSDNASIVVDPNTGQIGIYENGQYNWGQPGQAITSSGPYAAPYWNDNTPPPAPPPLPSYVPGDGQYHLYEDFSGSIGTDVSDPYKNDAFEPYWDAVEWTHEYTGRSWVLDGNGSARTVRLNTAGCSMEQNSLDYSSAYVGPWDGGYPSFKIFFEVDSVNSVPPPDHEDHHHHLEFYWTGGPAHYSEYIGDWVQFDVANVVIDLGSGDWDWYGVTWEGSTPDHGTVKLVLQTAGGPLPWMPLSLSGGTEYCLEIITSPAKWMASVYPSAGSASWWLETPMEASNGIDPVPADWGGYFRIVGYNYESEGEVYRLNGIDANYASPPVVFQNFHDVQIALGDDATASFQGHPTIDGTVVWSVDGLVVQPLSFDESTGDVTFDRAPAYLSIIAQSGQYGGR